MNNVVNLTKNQTINLTKANGTSIDEVLITANWGPNLKVNGMPEADVDIMGVLQYGSANKDVIYFGNLASKDGAVALSGDNRTGEDVKDQLADEFITVDFKKAAGLERLTVLAGVFEGEIRNQTFGDIKDLVIMIIDNTDKNNKVVLGTYKPEITAGNSRAMICAELIKNGNSFVFKASEMMFDTQSQSLEYLGFSVTKDAK